VNPADQYSSPLGFSSLFAFCGLPLRLDSYKGCGFSCTYCFARARETVGGTPHVRPADPDTLHRHFRRVFVDKREDLSAVSECIGRRMPIQLGAMGDPFQVAERRFRVSEHYLRAAAEYGYPLVISTRGALIAEQPYLDLLKAQHAVVVRLSLSTVDDERSAVVEHGDVRPTAVLRTMEKLSSAGIRVACRWQPYIPGLSEDPELLAPRIAAAGCQHCSFEFLRLPRERNAALQAGFYRRTGEDIYKRYETAKSLHRVREYILPAEQRLPTILRARSAIRAAGMRFGAADNDLQYLSDDACCCSGVDAVPGFEGFFRHQVAFAVRRNFGRRITFGSIAKEWTPKGSIDRYLNSGRRIAAESGSTGSVRDHVARRWNTSGMEGSPDSFFGVEATGERSASGMRIYRWNAAKLEQLRSAVTL
jgi:DNA repair photolyase